VTVGVPPALRELVRQRAHFRCEYCLIHEEDALFPHVVDHIIARKHGGPTHENNLAWSCMACNAFKGSDLASINPETGRIVRLFNPRKQQWARHFRLEDAHIVPLTAKGLVTEYLLQFNRLRFVRSRRILILAGRYPR
jgi:hypothetical protein